MKINTKSYKLKDIDSNLSSSIAQRYNIKEEEIELIRKGIPIDSKSSLEEDSETGLMYISTKHTDRDGDIVVPSGVILDDYRKTPVVLWCHKYSMDDVPVGMNQWIKTDSKGLLAKTKYHTRPGTIGEKVYNYLKDGFPLACSIGFVVLEGKTKDEFHELDIKSLGLEDKDIKKADRIFTKTLLMEYSMVPVASNQDSVVLSMKNFGIDTEDEYLYKIENIELQEESNGEQEIKETEIQETKESGTDDSNTEEKEVGSLAYAYANLTHTKENPEWKVGVDFSVYDDHVCINENVIDNGETFTLKLLPVGEVTIKTLTSGTSILDDLLSEITEDNIHPETEVKEVSTIDEIIEIEDKSKLTDDEDEDDKPKKEFCDCESFDGEEDNCKACGGKRKPKKSIEEIFAEALSQFKEEIIPLFGKVESTEEVKEEISDIDILKSEIEDLRQQLNDQKELINILSTKSIESKDIEIEFEEKEFPIEIETKEVEYTDDEIISVVSKIMDEKTNINYSELVNEAIMKLKGRMY